MASSDNLPASAGGRVDEATNTEFVGHEWDGIEELDTPMPRWWLWTFYITIVFAIGYCIAYPAWPLISKGTEGVLGWTSRGQLADQMSLADQARVSVREQIAAIDVEKLAGNENLMSQAVAGGAAAFKVNCVQCHGAGAAGSKGFPNLNDDDWLWGGDLGAIQTTLIHGIRQPGDEQTHNSMMPAFGRDGLLSPAEIDDVADYVLTLSGGARPGASSRRGAEIFATQCSSCHGPDGKGLREFGAPNLADAIWLYGKGKDAVKSQINNPSMGVMPAWGDRLDPVTIKMLAAYVHSLGGGEDFAEVAASPAAEANEQP